MHFAVIYQSLHVIASLFLILALSPNDRCDFHVLALLFLDALPKWCSHFHVYSFPLSLEAIRN